MIARLLHVMSLSLVLGLLASAASQAQQEDLTDSMSEPQEAAAPARKRPSWLHRPAKDTAAEQLAFADDLQKRGKLSAARRHYLALVHAWHESAEAPIAQLRYAEILEQGQSYAAAFREYQYLVDQFPGDFPFEDIVDRQFRMANLARTTRRGRLFFFRGFLAPERALPLFEAVARNAPQGTHGAEARFAIGEIHEELGDLDEAVIAYEALQVSRPSDPLAEAASFRRAVCLAKLVQSQPRSEPSYREALSALSMFLNDHPRSPHAAEAKDLLDDLKERLSSMVFERAVYYDRTVRRPESALIAYMDFVRNFPQSGLVPKANERIDTLKLELEKRNEKQ